MTKITCYVADLKVDPNLPPIGEFELDGRPISDYFRAGSVLLDGTPAIDLTIDQSRRHVLQSDPGLGVDTQQLREALGQLIPPEKSTGHLLQANSLTSLRSGSNSWRGGLQVRVP